VLRGPRPRPGSDGLAHALHTFRAQLEKHRGGQESDLHRSDPRIGLHDSELAEATEFVAALARALAPLEGIADQSHRLSDVAALHREVLAALSVRGGDEVAFAGPDGAKLADALDELATSKAAAALLVDTSDYVELFGAALADRVVRPPPRAGARVRILGTIEARLTDSDCVVLGGLVEGTWPPESRADGWLSRPMRLDLGLDLPERRVGLTAHDFTQLAGAEEVVLSHAAKLAGTPTVPSRFIQRLAAVAGKERWKAALASGESYLSWARALDRTAQVEAAPQPAPKPPPQARPKGLSVTDIEDWLRDPYTIYAKYILRLAPLDAVDLPPGAAERGTIIHAAIADFTKRFKDGLSSDPARDLIDLGKPHFATLEDFPEVSAFWWPRFKRIADWFARWEAQRRPDIRALVAELRGEIPLPGAAFMLRGIADRIERHADGRYVILDYKTGSARTEKQVRTGLAPQLTLEAAILRQGGFPDIAMGSSVAQIGYVLLKGGPRPGEPKMIEFTEGTTDSQADRALEKLAVLAGRFAKESEPYRSLVHPMWTTHYGDYDHLARVKEWSATGGEFDDIWGSE
jgi:ATP-dependent helicase/nuclease subunit B